MIISWRLARFKAIKDQMEQLTFGDLTLFTGVNSSGKSTVIQSMLMMMQTISNRENTSLHINGELVRLGQVDDIWYGGELPDGDPEKRLKIEVLVKGDGENALYMLMEFEPLRETEVRLVFAEYARGNEEIGYDERLVIEWQDNAYRITEMSLPLQQAVKRQLQDNGLSQIKPFEGAQVEMYDYYPQRMLVQALTESDELNWSIAISNPLSDILTDDQLTYEILNEHVLLIRRAVVELNLPEFSSGSVVQVPRLRDYREWYGKLTAKQAQRLRDYLLTEKRDDLTKSVESLYTTEFFNFVENTVRKVFTQRIHYVSAFRVSPSTVYSLGAEPYWSDVGVDGRYVANALKEHGERVIVYWNPIARTVEESSLLEAVYVWLRFFKLLDRVEVEDFGKLGTMLKVFQSGMEKSLDLTAVGFGTSQILPIIVQGLLTPPHHLLIVEQPEVHIHPYVQSQLAYFFFALTRVNVQCVIETHSEYIVNQLRLLIAAMDETFYDKVRMYFAVRDPDDGTSYEEVHIDRNGKITNWPQFFMDESTRLAKEMLTVATEGITS